jgi:hypothetical protein
MLLIDFDAKKRYVFVVMLLIDFDDYDTGAACSAGQSS